MISIESTWRETGMLCTHCGHMTYSDGFFRPRCGSNDCLEVVTDQQVRQHLIANPSLDEIAHARRWRLFTEFIDIPVDSDQEQAMDAVLSLYCYEERDRK